MWFDWYPQESDQGKQFWDSMEPWIKPNDDEVGSHTITELGTKFLKERGQA